MNTYYECIKTIKETFEQDDRVKSVTTGDFEEWDTDMFAMVHLEVLSSPFISQNNLGVVRYTVSVNVVDIRDWNKEDDKDIFWHNDNRHDTWNETRSILKIAANKLLRSKDAVRLVVATDAEPVMYLENMNGLDGWQQTWTIDVIDSLTNNCKEC